MLSKYPISLFLILIAGLTLPWPISSMDGRVCALVDRLSPREYTVVVHRAIKELNDKLGESSADGQAFTEFLITKINEEIARRVEAYFAKQGIKTMLQSEWIKELEVTFASKLVHDPSEIMSGLLNDSVAKVIQDIVDGKISDAPIDLEVLRSRIQSKFGSYDQFADFLQKSLRFGYSTTRSFATVQARSNSGISGRFEDYLKGLVEIRELRPNMDGLLQLEPQLFELTRRANGKKESEFSPEYNRLLDFHNSRKSPPSEDRLKAHYELQDYAQKLLRYAFLLRGSVNNGLEGVRSYNAEKDFQSVIHVDVRLLGSRNLALLHRKVDEIYAQALLLYDTAQKFDQGLVGEDEFQSTYLRMQDLQENVLSDSADFLRDKRQKLKDLFMAKAIWFSGDDVLIKSPLLPKAALAVLASADQDLRSTIRIGIATRQSADMDLNGSRNTFGALFASLKEHELRQPERMWIGYVDPGGKSHVFDANSANLSENRAVLQR